jgi:tetratricopeptide (TPR) repeat protein
MALVIIGQGARSLTGQRAIGRTAFDGPLWLFLVSTAMGLVIAYDWAAAWPRFWLILGGFMVYNTLAILPDQVDLNDRKGLPILWITLIALPAGIALLALLTNDWGDLLARIPWHTPVRTGIQWLDWPGPAIHRNATAGTIATFLPLQVAAWHERPSIRLNTWIARLAISLSVAALLISGSLGAWLALAVVLGGRTVWRTSEHWLGHLRQKPIAMGSIALTVGLLIGILILPNIQLLKLREDRLTVWRNSLDLASDYPLTGVGLVGFRMAYSSYTLLVHVGHTSHAHNLLLDIWLKHGALGLLALGWLMFRVARLAPSESPWRPAALSSLGVLLLHGLVDDAFYGYAPQMSLWLFVPLAILSRTVKAIEPIETVEKAKRGWPLFPMLGGSILMIGVLIFALFPQAQAILHANWGAVLQTRTELAAYRWPQWTIQDELRRSPQIHLEPAIAHYQMALALDRSNPTANRRLGQIELSRGEYEAARRHLITAYAAAPWQRATRQLLGEVYAIAGEAGQAASLWQTIDVGQGQLGLRRKWYLRVGERERADRITRAAALAEVRSR